MNASIHIYFYCTVFSAVRKDCLCRSPVACFSSMRLVCVIISVRLKFIAVLQIFAVVPNGHNDIGVYGRSRHHVYGNILAGSVSGVSKRNRILTGNQAVIGERGIKCILIIYIITIITVLRMLIKELIKSGVMFCVIIITMSISRSGNIRVKCSPAEPYLLLEFIVVGK